MAKKKAKTPTLTKEPGRTNLGAHDVLNGLASIGAAYELGDTLLTDADGSPVIGTPREWGLEIFADTKRLNEGDFSTLIGRLNAQFMMMEFMFLRVSRLAIGTTGLDQMTKLGALAMRIQSNARCTAEAISNLKYPRQQVNFVTATTANLTSGPQQNNVEATAQVEKTLEQNELLSEVGHVMDTRAQTEAARGYPAVEAVDTVHRTTD